MDSERKRHNDLLRKYGLTLEGWKYLLEQQNYQCKICYVDFDLNNPRSGNAPVVDHSHSTGKVRGVLCSQCNKGVGCFKDDLNIVHSVLNYLNLNLNLNLEN